MKKFIKNCFRRLGYDLIPYQMSAPPTAAELDSLADLTEQERAIVARVKPLTLTGVIRVAALLNSINHIVDRRIPGDLVECGVWRGGSMMAAALALIARGDTTRSLYLYDTFEGMPPPTEVDRSVDGVSAEDQLRNTPRGLGVWCEAGLEDVRANMLSTGYPEDKIHFVKGKVEETIPQTIPKALALLRLDTDWYESTRHELIHLYPLLSPNGILIIDDYGHWQGSRKAVDEYFAGRPNIFLHRMDAGGRMLVRAANE